MATKSKWIEMSCGHDERHSVSGYDGKACDAKAEWIAHGECRACLSAAVTGLEYNEWTHPRTGEIRRYVRHLEVVCNLPADVQAKAWLDEDGALHTFNLADTDIARLTELAAKAELAAKGESK